MKKLLILLTIFLTSFLSACATTPKPDKLILKQTNYDNLPNWSASNHAPAIDSLLNSCNKEAPILTEDIKKSHPEINFSEENWQDICFKAAFIDRKNKNKAREFFEQNFTPYKAYNNDKSNGIFTGYYVPILKGSRSRRGVYQYPVYGKPSDALISRIGGEFSRADIDNGILANHNLEILWLDDPVMLFFAHIQGSALVEMDRGDIAKITYAGKNGYKYTAIGRVLADMGEIKEISLKSIRDWLYKNPDLAPYIMQKNESFVYFTLDDNDEIRGAANVPLTAERSLAIDKNFIPYNLPIYLDVKINDVKINDNFQQILITQDTGGAIKGAIRGDIFFGAGKNAEKKAGYMNARGEYYLLMPNGS